jgi:hypothetical protein
MRRRGREMGLLLGDKQCINNTNTDTLVYLCICERVGSRVLLNIELDAGFVR